MNRLRTAYRRLLILFLCFTMLVSGVPATSANANNSAPVPGKPAQAQNDAPTATPSPRVAMNQFEPLPWQRNAAQTAPFAQTAGTTLIRITEQGFTPNQLVIFGPTDVTWVNETTVTHIVKGGEPDPVDTQQKLYLPSIQSFANLQNRHVQRALEYLTRTVDEEAFIATLAPGATFTRRFETPGAYRFHLQTAPQLTGEITLSGTGLVRTSPSAGEDGVAATRETIVEFSGPLDATTVTEQVFSARFGQRNLPIRLVLSKDQRRVTLFYQEPLPGSARIRVTINGDQLKDAAGLAVDVDGDGVAGGVRLFEFDTLSVTVLPGTQACGRVFASELGTTAAGISVNTPLQGATITVDGVESTLRTTTDANGNFCLNPAPAGRFFVHIDGRTATNGVPAGAYYPFVGKTWSTVPGQQTNVGDVYLPLIIPGTLQPVSQSQDTLIDFPDQVLAEHPEFEGVTVLVPADSLFSDDGSRGGQVGIAPVPPDRIPGELPEGLEFAVVITVQTDGAMNFDVPAPVCFPNLPDPVTGETLAAGSKSALWSFNHDSGRWEIVGPMQVSNDARLVCTAPGVGVRAPGWHGNQPGSEGGGPNNPLPPGSPTPPPGSPTPPPGSPTPSTPTPTPCPKIDYPDFVDITLSGASCFKELAKLHEAIDKLWDLAVEFASLIRDLKKAKAEYQGGKISALQVRQLVRSIQAAARSIKTTFELIRDQTAGKLDGIISCAQSAVSLLDKACRDFASVPQQCLSWRENRLLKPYCIYAHNALKVSLISARLLSDDLQKAMSNFVFDAVDQIASEIIGYIDQNQPLVAATAQGVATPDPKLIEMLTRLEQAADDFSPSEEVLTGANRVYASLFTHSAMIGDYYIVVEDPIPNAYVLLEYDGIQQRTRSTDAGSYRFFMSADTVYGLSLFDPVTGECGVSIGVSAEAGDFTKLHGPSMGACPPNDTDGDGLPDLAEDIVGTSLNTADTDGDGISDGAEVQQGTDPLSGFIAQTGIVGTANTTGYASDICVDEDMAVVADGEAGVAVFNVFDMVNPSLVAQVDTPGRAQRIACAAGRAAVADDSAGLAVVDYGTAANARILHQINLSSPVNAVAMTGDLIVAATQNGRVALIDAVNGGIRSEISLSEPVQDLAIQADVLYILTPGDLHAASLQDNQITLLGSAESPGTTGAGRRKWRLFVGGDMAYVTHTRGNNTHDVSNPQDPRLIAAGRTQQFGWKKLVTTGSGHGVAAVSPNSTNDGPHHVWLYDTSDPAQTDVFLTLFETPGRAESVFLYKGLAYVADGEAGMQVINYLAYDSGKQAPTLTVSTNFAPGRAEEAAPLLIRAQATDNVQVRLVEFFIDGERAAVDGSFPFEYRYLTPRIAEQPSFTLRVRAVDTGGNETWSSEETISLVQDATPPRIMSVSPANGLLVGEDMAGILSVQFNEAIAPSTLNGNSFRLFTSGPDGVLGSEDDVPVTGGVTGYDGNSRTATLTFATLPTNRYRAVISGGVTDEAGNPLVPYEWTFTVVPVIQIGQVVNGEISVAGEIDTYFFTAQAGQRVYFDAQASSDWGGTNWRTVDSAGGVVFSSNQFGDGGPHVLSRGGTYTLTVDGNFDSTSTYRFQIIDDPDVARLRELVTEELESGRNNLYLPFLSR